MINVNDQRSTILINEQNRSERFVFQHGKNIGNITGNTIGRQTHNGRIGSNLQQMLIRK